MIKGKINGSSFIFDNGDITCDNKEAVSIMRVLWDNIMVGFKPQDGMPELFMEEKLKKIGVKDVEYIEEPEQDGIVY